MRSLQLLVLALLATAARADLFPTYQYFYPCDSGVVDCNAFPKHWYGDYGLTGYYPNPTNLSLDLGGAYFTPQYSNNKGEAVGQLKPDKWVPMEAYASQGILYGAAYGVDDAADGFQTVDINNNGFYLFNTMQVTFHTIIGFGGQTEVGWVQIHVSDAVDQTWGQVFWTYGINDNNQLLVDMSQYLELLHNPSLCPGPGPCPEVHGVLSPFAIPAPVPEPSALLLLALALCACAALAKAREVRASRQSSVPQCKRM